MEKNPSLFPHPEISLLISQPHLCHMPMDKQITVKGGRTIVIPHTPHPAQGWD